MNAVSNSIAKHERFIPVDLEGLVQDLLASPVWEDTSRQAFMQFCNRYLALFHVHMYPSLRKVRRQYQPFNPDSDRLSAGNQAHEQAAPRVEILLDEVSAWLGRANFEPLPIDAINAALTKTSPHGVEVSVDLEEFEHLALFCRGSSSMRVSKRDWRRLYLRNIELQIPIYRRLFMLLKLKRDPQLEDHQNSAAKPAQGLGYQSTDCVYFKLFKNIPHSDLEMLFPNTRVRMRRWDKLRLGITGGGGSLGGLMATITKVGAATNPYTIVLAVGGFAGVLWRQVSNVLTQRTKYMAALTHNLYFYNLDNNFGAITHLLEMAEREEGKEAILAYFFLVTHPSKTFTAEQLDRKVEEFMVSQYAVEFDYEVKDGLAKLQALEIVQVDAQGLIDRLDLPGASEQLAAQWQRAFAHEPT